MSLVANKSNTSELIADPEDDGGGNGSVRHVPNRSDSEDVGLVLKLQQRLKTVEKDKASLATRVEELERESPTADVRRAQDMIRLQELEMENAKIKDDLKNLRRQAATENEVQLPRSLDMLMSQFDAMSDELDRRREECEPCWLTRLLEVTLEEKASSQRKIQIEREEVERLRLDNEQQAKLLAGALHRTPQGQTDAVIQHEISRLTADNLDLQEKNDLLSEQLKKYRSQMKLAKKVKQEGVPAENQEASPEVHETLHSTRWIERSESPLPVVRKKETNYLGMFDFNVDDEEQIARNLVYELKPSVASTLLPGLPAYIIFMCVRHADHINSDEKIRSFLILIINAIRRLIKKRHEDLDTLVVWLVNTCRLVDSLKQYSGEKTFQEENDTLKQNEQCLRNFDLSNYRQAVIKCMEERVQKLIVTAVLEHDHIAHLLRKLTIFHQVLQLHGVDPTLIAQAFRQILPSCIFVGYNTILHSILNFSPYLSGVLLNLCVRINNLLLRNEMCHWSKGIQIRYTSPILKNGCVTRIFMDRTL
ncbi:hypothetical protein DAPPUDRAFT_100958 [Daphnia pulex]|uniref:Dilute domain-containing protein n=1 Tax=Daphnia pulex TaxID=6669 RepID=E9GBS6_DAPPU|nr:hypothetical protein DAPPUDRAFT_100958 [Daphnia pulex]|eukprot:EFX83009.1 hypothetical protein DAPPUDRAFT_100958 [Daphnia pulex]